MTEQELASMVVDWLTGQHWDVYQEVQLRYGGPIWDIVALRNNIVEIIEVKKSLTISVIEQAWRSINCAHYVVVAVPTLVRGTYARDSRAFTYRICRDYGIGVYEIDKYDVINKVPPQLHRQNRNRIKKTINSLNENFKIHAKAGSANGGQWTPYRNTMNAVKSILIEHGPLTLKQIMEHLSDHHYSNDKSALTCIRKALTLWEDWAQCEVGKRGEFTFSVKK